jgi:hypothetical protein
MTFGLVQIGIVIVGVQSPQKRLSLMRVSRQQAPNGGGQVASTAHGDWCGLLAEKIGDSLTVIKAVVGSHLTIPTVCARTTVEIIRVQA